ncbi:hypothetical protein AHAS_Ahas01G0149300 [Arachis hypogaea]
MIIRYCLFIFLVFQNVPFLFKHSFKEERHLALGSCLFLPPLHHTFRSFCIVIGSLFLALLPRSFSALHRELSLILYSSLYLAITSGWSRLVSLPCLQLECLYFTLTWFAPEFGVEIVHVLLGPVSYSLLSKSVTPYHTEYYAIVIRLR